MNLTTWIAVLVVIVMVWSLVKRYETRMVLITAGIVLALAGSYRDPERLAYHKPGLPPRRLYRVRFRMQDLWERYDGGPDDTLEADLYEHWLEAIDEEQPT